MQTNKILVLVFLLLLTIISISFLINKKCALTFRYYFIFIMFPTDEEFVETGDASSPFYLIMMFILTPLVVSRRVKRSAAFVRQKLGTGVKRTMSRSIRGLSSTARRITRMKNFVKKPRNLMRKPKAPSKVC